MNGVGAIVTMRCWDGAFHREESLLHVSDTLCHLPNASSAWYCDIIWIWINKMKNSSTDKSDDKNSTDNQNTENVEDRNPLHLSEYEMVTDFF